MSPAPRPRPDLHRHGPAPTGVIGSVVHAACNLTLVLSAAALVVALLTVTAGSASAAPLEDYADYEPASRCAPRAKPGATVLGQTLERRFGGAFGGVSRPCGRDGVTSEHEEGRAIDWTLDADAEVDRAAAQRFLDFVFRTDRKGRTHAKARRMGIMYLIWNDQIFSAWHGFEARPYLNSGCVEPSTCSDTLRHRDHMHISLTRQAAAGGTSWYAGRL